MMPVEETSTGDNELVSDPREWIGDPGEWIGDPGDNELVAQVNE